MATVRPFLKLFELRSPHSLARAYRKQVQAGDFGDLLIQEHCGRVVGNPDIATFCSGIGDGPNAGAQAFP